MYLFVETKEEAIKANLISLPLPLVAPYANMLGLNILTVSLSR